MAYSDKVLDHYTNPRNVGSLDKNSAEVGTGLVLMVLGLGRAGLLGEVVDRVHGLIAVVLVRRPVERVGTRLGRDADRGTGRSAVLRRVRAGDDLELLNRIH